jgi:hypothetical protein
MTASTEPQTVPDWQKDRRLLPIVNNLKLQMRHELVAALDSTDCFGLFVIENEGVCPEADHCALASYCQRAYQMTQVQAGQNVRAPIAEALVVPASPVLQPPQVITPTTTAELDVAIQYARPLFGGRVERERSLARTQQVRNKWKGTDKYLRQGYTPCGRHVDALLAMFKTELPKLPELPLVWNAKNFEQKFSRLGEFTMSATTSYHTVLRDGVVLCRFWTNTVKQAIVDILPELEAPLRKVSQKLGLYRYRDSEILQLEAPHKVPAQSWVKLRPCTHRVIVRTPEAAREVGRVVRQHWKIGS